MTVDGADVVESHLLEQGRRADHALDVLLGAPGQLQRARQVREHALAVLAHHRVRLADQNACQIARHAADVLGDRHLVVVENHQHVGIDMAGMRQRLECHARAQGAIADDRTHTTPFALGPRRQRHAQRRRDRGARMTDTEGVIGRLVALGKRRQTPELPNGRHLLATPGQDLVGVGLVADVPHQAVIRRIQDVMQGHGQLDHAQAGAEVSAGTADAVQQIGTQLVGQLAQLGRVEIV